VAIISRQGNLIIDAVNVSSNHNAASLSVVNINAIEIATAIDTTGSRGLKTERQAPRVEMGGARFGAAIFSNDVRRFFIPSISPKVIRAIYILDECDLLFARFDARKKVQRVDVMRTRAAFERIQDP
jgi:hypothetical protein